MKKWLVNRTNPEYVDYLSRAASVSPTFAQVLISRGLKTPGQIDTFLSPDTERLSDPFDLPGMREATERIIHANRQGERVLVHGDYDADGVSATAVLTEGLRRLGLDVQPFIPNRVAHGYGFGTAGVERAKETGAGLIITVDCGITSFEAVTAAKALGIDVIITDHHEPVRQITGSGVQGPGSGKDSGEDDRCSMPPDPGPRTLAPFLLPEAVAVINPKLVPDSELSILSGAGVAFHLVRALLGNDANDLIDLAAIGTGADVVPLTGDNRIILREGLRLIRAGGRTGMQALKEAAGMKGDSFRTQSLYYMLIPRINAAGRIDDANEVVRLLTTQSEAEAEELALWLNRLNARRQEIEEAVYQDALKMLTAHGAEHDALVLAAEGWHPGVVGIVASRIAEQYCRPTFILTIENGVAKGSARSIPSFDIHLGLSRCGEVLTRFGGHKQAAGLSLPAGEIPRFREMISRVVRESLSEEDYAPSLRIDAAVALSGVTISLIDEFSRLEPFGYGNEEPLLASKGLDAAQPRIVGNNHLKMYLRQRGSGIDSIGFAMGDLLSSLEKNSRIDAAFMPAINEWNGGRYLQLNLRAIRPSE